MTDVLLVLARDGAESTEITSLLLGRGLESQAVDDRRLIEAIENNCCSLAILTDDQLALMSIADLTSAISAQAAWSDCPLLVLARRGRPRDAKLSALLEIANVTLLERPWHVTELMEAVHTALRGRQRQRRAATYLYERESAQAQVRNLATTLETRVAERTIELRRALAIGSATTSLLRESEELHRITVELSNQTVWTASSRGAVTSVAGSWSELTGRSVEDALGHRWRRLVYPDDRLRLRTQQREARTRQGPIDDLYRLRDARGAYRWWRVRAAPRHGDDGQIIRFYGMLEDVNERFQVEAQVNHLQNELVHVARVSAMGTLASSLAHELNQPLASVVNYVRGTRRRIIEGRCDDSGPILEALAQADHSAVRASEIVRRLREMIARGKVQTRRTNLASLINEACGLALIDARALGISHKFDHDSSATWVEVDRIQMQQVLINLMRNAVEALTGMARRQILIATHARGGQAAISVSDNGPGLRPSIITRLFESFNSSKADGMGIGLSISRSIVEAHGGTLSYAPTPGGGATFTITLPLAADDGGD